MSNLLVSQKILKHGTEENRIIVGHKNFSANVNSAIGLSVLCANVNEELFEPFFRLGFVRHEINVAVLSETAFDDKK